MKQREYPSFLKCVTLCQFREYLESWSFDTIKKGGFLFHERDLIGPKPPVCDGGHLIQPCRTESVLSKGSLLDGAGLPRGPL